MSNPAVEQMRERLRLYGRAPENARESAALSEEAILADYDRTPTMHLSEASLGILVLARAAARIHALCESPIEKMMGAQLICLFERRNKPLEIGKGKHGARLVPQYRWRRWRMDFALTVDGAPRMFVECDGVEFHSSIEQLRNDRAKDAAAGEAGIKLLRFTGKEIWHAGEACALVVAEELSRP